MRSDWIKIAISTMTLAEAKIPISAIWLSPSKRLSGSRTVALYAINARARAIRTYRKYFMFCGKSVKQFLNVGGKQFHGDGQQYDAKYFLNDADAIFTQNVLKF